jgi:hypothetical protein
MWVLPAFQRRNYREFPASGVVPFMATNLAITTRQLTAYQVCTHARVRWYSSKMDRYCGASHIHTYTHTYMYSTSKVDKYFGASPSKRRLVAGGSPHWCPPPSISPSSSVSIGTFSQTSPTRSDYRDSRDDGFASDCFSQASPLRKENHDPRQYESESQTSRVSSCHALTASEKHPATSASSNNSSRPASAATSARSRGGLDANAREQGSQESPYSSPPHRGSSAHFGFDLGLSSNSNSSEMRNLMNTNGRNSLSNSNSALHLQLHDSPDKSASPRARSSNPEFRIEANVHAVKGAQEASSARHSSARHSSARHSSHALGQAQKDDFVTAGKHTNYSGLPRRAPMKSNMQENTHLVESYENAFRRISEEKMQGLVSQETSSTHRLAPHVRNEDQDMRDIQITAKSMAAPQSSSDPQARVALSVKRIEVCDIVSYVCVCVCTRGLVCEKHPCLQCRAVCMC